MTGEDLRIIKDRAFSALAKGKLRRALAYFEELEEREPDEGAWPGKIGETQRQLGQNEEAIAALSRATDKYFQEGFLAKAIATGKMILRIQADHSILRESVAILVMGKEKQKADTEPTVEPVEIDLEAPSIATDEVDVLEPPVEIEPDSPRPPPPPIESISLAEIMGLEDGDTDGEIPIEIEEPGSTTDAEVQETLLHTKLFQELSPEGIGQLIQGVTLVEIDPGQTLFRQGDPAESLFIVAEGELEVITGDTPHRRLSRLKESDFFGEIGLIAGQPRNATVRALEPTRLLELNRAVIRDLMAEEPAVLKVLLHFLRGRLVDTLIKTHPLFQSFAGAERRDLAGRFRLLELRKDTEIISQGEPSPGLYVMLSGAAEVVREIAGVSTRIAVLGSGDLAGEMSLLKQEGAVATVRIARRAFAFQLPAQAFRELIMTHPQVLEYVGELAEERRLELEAIEHSQECTREARLQLL